MHERVSGSHKCVYSRAGLSAGARVSIVRNATNPLIARRRTVTRPDPTTFGVDLASVNGRCGDATEALASDGCKPMSTKGWVCALAMMATTVTSAKEPLALRVSPAMSFAPADLMIRARVEPDADNRAMEVVAESGDFYRSSSIQLEGDRAPRTVTLEFRGLPPGEYAVTAVVIGNDGQRRGLARSHVNVMESGASR
jgi:hypothetical protein